MIKRILEDEIFELLSIFPVIGIIGPRQSGKTTLAKMLIKRYPKNSIYLDLESPSDRNKLKRPEIFFDDNKNNCVVLDEIQRMPELFPLLRSVIDNHRIPGSFIT